MRALGVLAGAALFAACSVAPGVRIAAHPLDDTIWDTATGAQIGREALVLRLRGARVVIVGELHDNADHHLAQAWLTGALKPSGMAFEMISRASEEGIAVFLKQGGDPAGIGPAIGWERSGWPDWDIYRPIFQTWRPGIYTGGGLPRAEVRRATREGAAPVAAAAALDPVLAGVLTEDIDPGTRSQMEDEMVAAHCGHLPRTAAPGMIEAQRLRDAALADAVLRALGEDGAGRVVLITGNGHARKDRAVPVYLAALKIGSVSIGLLETDEAEETVDGYLSDRPFDFIWLLPPAVREDPCAAFK